MTNETNDKLLQRAEAGNSDAQFQIGARYEEGFCIGRDLTKAQFWYSAAAEKQNSDAMAALGSLLLDGAYGMAADPVAGVKWLEASARAGNQNGQFGYGTALSFGKGCVKDAVAAEYWFRLSAEQGNRFAMTNLGCLLLEGDGMPRKEREGCSKDGKWSGDANARVCFEAQEAGRGSKMAEPCTQSCKRTTHSENRTKVIFREGRCAFSFAGPRCRIKLPVANVDGRDVGDGVTTILKMTKCQPKLLSEEQTKPIHH